MYAMIWTVQLHLTKTKQPRMETTRDYIKERSIVPTKVDKNAR